MPRPYRDGDDLWELKRGFELELGSGTGDEGKAARYEEKLDEDYRDSYEEWVTHCVAENPQTVQVAVDGDDLIGYVFVLPESMAHIWDAAVLNELYVVEHARGSGVVDDLLEAALDVAREQDLPLDRLVLDVDSDNERAMAVYDRWEFSGWGTMVAREL